MSDYTIGWGRPPKDAQFKPGQSGNPKGRPRSAPRAEVPSQIGKDVRAVCRRTITMKTPDGPLRLTLGQAIIYRIAMDALAGKVSQQRLLVQLLREAYTDNVIQNDVLAAFDKYASELTQWGSRDGAIQALVTSLAERSKRG